jgi:hypothetical protein
MNEEQAGAIARRTAEEEGWAFGRSGRWEIFLNARALGAKVRVVLDDETRAVIDEGYVPR